MFASHLSISDIRTPISQVQLSTGDLVAGTFGVNEPLSAVRLFVQINHVKEEGKEAKEEGEEGRRESRREPNPGRTRKKREEGEDGEKEWK